MRLSSEFPEDPRRVVWLIRGTLAVLAGWLLLLSPWESMLLKATAAAVVAGALWPISAWVQRRSRVYPLVETLLAVTLPFYALPLVLEHRLLLMFSEETVQTALSGVLLFQIAVIGAARLVPEDIHALQSAGWTEPLIPVDRLHLIGHGLLLNTAWLFVSTFTTLVPPDLMGSFRALFFGVGLISAFTLARLWSHDVLSPGEKAWMGLNLIAQVALIAASLLLIHALTLIGVVVLGYFSTTRRVPWLLVAVSLVMFTILHSGKGHMRVVYWDEDRPTLRVSDLPTFFAEWFEAGVKNLGRGDQGGKLLLLERSSLLQIASHVVDRVPERVPYLSGESYASIPLQVVPRPLWPDKPSPTESVSLLSVGLGLLSREQAETTSIGFGMIAEAYANFGLGGTALVGAVLGLLLQWIAATTANAADFSVHGLLRVLCLAWCLNAEMTAALWTSSLYQACLAVIIPLLAWRLLAGR
jgi:hypothetical protein